MMHKSLWFKFIGAWHFQTIIEEIIDRHSVRSFSSLLCPMHRKLKSIWTVSAVCLFSYIQPVVGILWHPKQFLPVLSKLESFSLLFWLNLPYSSLYTVVLALSPEDRENCYLILCGKLWCIWRSPPICYSVSHCMGLFCQTVIRV